MRQQGDAMQLEKIHPNRTNGASELAIRMSLARIADKGKGKPGGESKDARSGKTRLKPGLY